MTTDFPGDCRPSDLEQDLSSRYGQEQESEKIVGRDTEDQRHPFERDRDRILYSREFRRLKDVTQVARAGESYLYHDRLTHSLNMAQVGRRLAELLVECYEDEYVRQALERGCDRDAVMTVLNISRRSTFYKQKRARAYDIPLAAIRKRGGGRPLSGEVRDDGVTDTDEQPDTPGESQQRFDTTADETDRDATTPAAIVEATTDGSRGEHQRRESQASSEQAEFREYVQQAIAALQ